MSLRNTHPLLCAELDDLIDQYGLMYVNAALEEVGEELQALWDAMGPDLVDAIEPP